MVYFEKIFCNWYNNIESIDYDMRFLKIVMNECYKFYFDTDLTDYD